MLCIQGGLSISNFWNKDFAQCFKVTAHMNCGVTQSALPCSKSTMKTPEQCVKTVHSY